MVDPVPAALADAFVTASRALVGIAVRSIQDAAVDITVAQHRLLVLVSERGELTIGEVAVALNVDPSNASRHCDRLERLGLLERRRSASDRRVVSVVLTDAARTLLTAVTRRRQSEVRAVLRHLEPTDAQVLVDALQSFNDAAQRKAEEDWAVAGW